MVAVPAVPWSIAVLAPAGPATPGICGASRLASFHFDLLEALLLFRSENASELRIAIAHRLPNLSDRPSMNGLQLGAAVLDNLVDLMSLFLAQIERGQHALAQRGSDFVGARRGESFLSGSLGGKDPAGNSSG